MKKLFSVLFCMCFLVLGSVAFAIPTEGSSPSPPRQVKVERMPYINIYGKRCGHQIKDISVKVIPHKKGVYSKEYYTDRPINFQVLALYTRIKDVLARNDRTGQVLSAELPDDCTPEPSPLQHPFTMELVEVRGGKVYPVPGNIWEGGPGYIKIKKEGYYRLRIKLTGYDGKPVDDPYRDVNPFRIGWVYSPLFTVYDQSKIRGPGSKVVVSMMIQSPKSEYPLEESTLEFDAKCKGDQPFIYCGRCDRGLTFSSYARWGIINEESEGGGTLKGTPGKPVPYRMAIWKLVDRNTGEVLEVVKNAFTYTFTPSYYGDGDYVLYAYTEEQFYGKLGLKNFFGKKPAKAYISVKNCGKGTAVREDKRHKGLSKREIEALEKENTKLNNALRKPVGVEIPRIEPGNRLVREKKKIERLTQGPTPPPSKPDLKGTCEILQKQIIERRNKLKVPCDLVRKLMANLVNTPFKAEKLLKKVQSDLIRVAELRQKWREPYYNLAKRYTAVIKKAAEAKLIIPDQVLKRFKRRSSIGTAPVIGDGLPPLAFLYKPQLIKLSKELDREQVQILTEWARQIRKDRLRKKELDREVEKLKNSYKELVDLIKEFYANQNYLKRLYCTGTYEHCLGKPLESYCAKEIGYFVVEEGRGKGQEDLFGGLRPANPLNIPGLNITLKIPDSLARAIAEQTKPFKDPPPRPRRFRFKGDGIWQLMQDRKLMEAELRKYEELEYNSTLTITAFNALVNGYAYWMEKATGKEYPDEQFRALREKIWETAKLNPIVATGHYGEKVLKGSVNYMKNMAVGLHAMATKVPVHELPNFYDAMWGIFTATADNVVKVIRGAEIYMGDYRTAMQKLRQIKGYTPQENARFVSLAITAIRALKGINKAWEAGGELLTDIAITFLPAGAVGEKAIAAIMKTYKVSRETAEIILKSLRGIEKGIEDVEKLSKTMKTLARAKGAIKELEHTRALLRVEDIEKRIIAGQQEKILQSYLKEQRALARRSGKFVEKSRVKLASGEEVSLGEKIGAGGLKEVYETKDPSKVAQLITRTDEEGRLAVNRLRQSARALDDAGVPYPKFEIKRLEDGRTLIISDRINPAAWGDKVKWTEEHQLAFTELIKKLNSKGYVWLDAKPSNVYFFRDSKGVLHAGVGDIDAVVKVPGGKLSPGAGLPQLSIDQIQRAFLFGEKPSWFSFETQWLQQGIAEKLATDTFRTSKGFVPYTAASKGTMSKVLTKDIFSKDLKGITAKLNEASQEFIKKLVSERGVDIKKILAGGEVTPEVWEKLAKSLSKDDLSNLKAILDINKTSREIQAQITKLQKDLDDLLKDQTTLARLQKEAVDNATKSPIQAQREKVLLDYLKKQEAAAQRSGSFVETRKVVLENGEELSIGKKIGEGTFKEVYDLKDPKKVAQILKTSDTEHVMALLDRMKESARALDDAGVPYTKFEIKRLKDGKTVVITDRINPSSIGDQIEWTKEHQLAFAELIKKLNQKGYVWTEAKPSSVYFFRDSNGVLRCGVVDIDAIKKLSGGKLNLPEGSLTAEQVQKLFLYGEKPEGFKDHWLRLQRKVAEALDVPFSPGIKQTISKEFYSRNLSSIKEELNRASEEFVNKLVKESKPAPKPVKAEKYLDTAEGGKKLAAGKELGRGTQGVVYINAERPDQIIKVSREKGKYAFSSMQQEAEVSNLLKKYGIEHTEVTEVGRLKDGSAYSIQRKLGKNEIEGLELYKKQGNRLTKEQQVALMELIQKMNKNNIVWGDFKLSNVYFKRLDNGRWVAGVLDKGGIKQIDGAYKVVKVRINGQEMYMWQKVAGGEPSVQITKSFLKNYRDFLSKELNMDVDKMLKALAQGRRLPPIKGEKLQKLVRYMQMVQMRTGSTSDVFNQVISLTEAGARGALESFSVDPKLLNAYSRLGRNYDEYLNMFRRQMAHENPERYLPSKKAEEIGTVKNNIEASKRSMDEVNTVLNQQVKDARNRIDKISDEISTRKQGETPDMDSYFGSKKSSDEVKTRKGGKVSFLPRWRERFMGQGEFSYKMAA